VHTRTVGDALQLSLWAVVAVILVAATLFAATFDMSSSQFKALPVVLAVPYEWGGPYGVFFATLGAGLFLITFGLLIDVSAIRRRKAAGAKPVQSTASASPFIPLESSKYLGKVFVPPPEEPAGEVEAEGALEGEPEVHPELEPHSDASPAECLAEAEPYTDLPQEEECIPQDALAGEVFPRTRGLESSEHGRSSYRYASAERDTTVR